MKYADTTFELKRFALTDTRCGLKLGTDGMLLGAWTRLPAGTRRICDAGAGCGIIGLMLAQRYPSVEVDAVESQPGACADAALNFDRSPWASRLHVRCADVTALTGRYDALVSNPPYFTTGERAPEAARAAARHAGTLSPTWLVEHAHDLLVPGGSLSLIMPADREADIICRATFARMYPRRICRVHSRPGKGAVRVLLELRTDDGPIDTTSLMLREADGTPTADYIALFQDFYLKL